MHTGGRSAEFSFFFRRPNVVVIGAFIHDTIRKRLSFYRERAPAKWTVGIYRAWLDLKYSSRLGFYKNALDCWKLVQTVRVLPHDFYKHSNLGQDEIIGGEWRAAFHRLFEYVGYFFGFRCSKYVEELTIECPKYSAALSDMYKSFPCCVIIIRNPLRAWKKMNMKLALNRAQSRISTRLKIVSNGTTIFNFFVESLHWNGIKAKGLSSWSIKIRKISSTLQLVFQKMKLILASKNFQLNLAMPLELFRYFFHSNSKELRWFSQIQNQRWTKSRLKKSKIAHHLRH